MENSTYYTPLANFRPSLTDEPVNSALNPSHDQSPPAYTREEGQRSTERFCRCGHGDCDVENDAAAAAAMLSCRRRRIGNGASRKKGKRMKRMCRRLARIGFCVGVLVLLVVFLIQILYFLLGWSISGWPVWTGKLESNREQGKQIGKLGQPKEYPYSTQYTDIIDPKPIHSHNDYWRSVPFYEAIGYGCISVEADVWKFDGDDELYVGHDPSSLSQTRSLSSLYINPILSHLKIQNRENKFAHNTFNGVFGINREQTLYLFIDIKTAGIPTYESVLEKLSPLRSPINYLTYYNASKSTSTITTGPVTVILTGNATFNHMVTSHPHYRDTFYDAPIDALLSQNGTEPYNSTNVLTATSQFSKVVDVGLVRKQEGLNEDQRGKIRQQIDKAGSKGIGIRYWDTPSWPIAVRNNVWKALVGEGVFLLNVDDLEAASKGVW